MPARPPAQPQSTGDLVALEAFFADRDAARALFEDLRTFVATCGGCELVATKSRVAFVRRTRFLWVHQANRDGSIQLAFLLPRALSSPRVRSGASGSRWSHHVRVAALDPEVRAWVAEAFAADAD